jgi:hypothetical protein
MNDERRQHQRKQWPSSINFQIKENAKAGPALKAETVDMSAGGICITTNQLLPPGTVLNFGTTRLVGIVRWSTPSDKDYKIGIELK